MPRIANILPFVLMCAACAMPVGQHPESPAEPHPGFDGRRDALLAALGAREAELASVLSDERRAALREERLTITVALAELERQGADAQNDPARDPQRLLADAKQRVAEARQRQHTRGKDHSRSQSGKRDETERDALRQGRKERRFKTPLEEGRRGCAAGDPLCDFGGMPPPPPPIVDEPEPAPAPDEQQPDGDARRAARVAATEMPKGVSRLVARHQARLRDCIPSELRVEGVHLQVRVRLDSNGRMREPRVLRSSLNPGVGACITDVFRGLRVDGHSGSSRALTIPLYLLDER